MKTLHISLGFLLVLVPQVAQAAKLPNLTALLSNPRQEKGGAWAVDWAVRNTGSARAQRFEVAFSVDYLPRKEPRVLVDRLAPGDGREGTVRFDRVGKGEHRLALVADAAAANLESNRTDNHAAVRVGVEQDAAGTPVWTPLPKLLFPLSEFRADTAPVSSMMDLDVDRETIALFDGTVLRAGDPGVRFFRYLGEGRAEEITATKAKNRLDREVIGFSRARGEAFGFAGLTYSDRVTVGDESMVNKILWYDGHTGYDYGANPGARVDAVYDGEVVQSGAKTKTGSPIEKDSNTVILRLDAPFRGIEARYLHMSVLPPLGRIKRGEKIGEVGKVGASDFHLHLGFMGGGRRVCPYREKMWE